MRICFRNFTGGEVTAGISARYDLAKFGSFLSCCENFIPNLHGDIERRPGTRFVSALAGPGILVPFQFNTDPENNYVLIFQEDSIKIADTGGLLPDVSMPSPYELAEVYELSTAQAGDVIYLAHKNHPLCKLTRPGTWPHYTWNLAEVALNRSLPPPAQPVAEFVRDNDDDKAELSYTLSYVVTAVDANGMESLASDTCQCEGKYPTDWVVGNHVNLTWQAVEGAAEYNIYRECAGYFGLIGVASAADATGGIIAGLRVGNEEGRLVHYAGHIQRNVVVGNGHVPDVDETGSLAVSAADRNAFIYDDRLFLPVTKSTSTTEWNPVYGDNGEVSWESIAMTGTEDFWVMLRLLANGEPAGIYKDWTTGKTDGDMDAPRGTFGPFTVEPAYAGATTLAFTDQNFEADTSKTPAEDWDPFADGNYPAVVAFHQQRLVLAGTKRDPASFFMSRSGDYESFRKSRPLQDDDPVEYMLASGSIDEIKWIASFGDLLIGTSGAEYQATSSGPAITPSDVQISVQSYWGSSGLKPMIIGQSVLHCQRAGSHARDLFYTWESDGYAGNDLSLLAPQLVENSRIVQWCFQQSPGSTVWACRDDGVLLCLTYMKEQNVFGWSRHVTQGRVLSVASICGSGEDILMLVVERELNGRKAWFLERLVPRFKDGDAIDDAFFVDCGACVEQEPDTICSGLSHLEGCGIVALADGSPVTGLVVQDGKIELPFAASKVVAGLNYTSVLAPLPLETDAQNGSTLGKRRSYGRCLLRLFRSVGGAYAASEPGDLFNPAAWRAREFYDLPFMPEAWGEPCQPFSGDMELVLPAGQDADTSIWIRQDKPLPFRLVAIMADVDFGEM